MKTGVFIILLSLFAGHLLAVDDLSRAFPGMTYMDNVDKPMARSGYGYYRVNDIRHFSSALYLPAGVSSFSQVVEGFIPFKLELRYMLRDTAEMDMQRYWNQAFEGAVPALDVRKRIGPYQQRFIDSIGALARNDQLSIEYHPDSGMLIRKNGREVSRIAGAEPTRSIIAIWLGDNAQAKAFRKELQRDFGQ